MNGKTVVLVRLPDDFGAGLYEIFSRSESLGLGYLAATLRQAGHTVHILDTAAIKVENLAGSLTPVWGARLAEEFLLQMAASDGQLDSTTMQWLAVKQYFAQQVMALEPDLVGFALCSNMNYGHTAEFVGYLRQLGLTVPIIAGGEQAALYAFDVLDRIPGLDACVLGEGEPVVLKLIESLEPIDYVGIAGLVWRNNQGAGISNGGHMPIQDLDTLPFPARDTLPAILEEGGMCVVSGSRGCPGRCGFCSIVEFYGESKHRGRSPQSIIDEIRDLYERHGADRFWFVDETFFGAGPTGRNRAREIFRLLIEAHLPIRFDFFCRAVDFALHQEDGTLDLAVQAGLRRAYIGVESGSAIALKNVYGKAANPSVNHDAIVVGETHGIHVVVEFIMFNPWATLQDLRDNLALLTSVPRGTNGEMGKYDPMALGSRLFAHRETALGQRLLTAYPDLVTGVVDGLVNYRFEHPEVGTLYELISAGFAPFAISEGVLDILYRMVDRLWLPEWSSRDDADEIRKLYTQYSEGLDALQSLRNSEALRHFEAGIALVESMSGDELTDGASGMARRMAFDSESVAQFIHAAASAQIRELWPILTQKGLLGQWTKPPFKEERR